MFKKILVPLDGSIESETVLPYVRDLAIRFGSEVDILSVGLGSKKRRVNQLLDDYVQHVVEHLQNNHINCRSVLVYSESENETIDFAQVATEKLDIRAKGKVFYGGPAETILFYTQRHHVNLIIMATHGHSGLKRWWLGSVFEKVISQCTVPVLVIHSKHVREIDREHRATFRHVLAPLDGSEAGESALHDAEEVAVKTGASITLLHVIPEPHAVEARFLGSEFTRFVKAMHDAGENYLTRTCNRLSEKGIKASYKIVYGDPAQQIIDIAAHEKNDLIALSTHGRSGITRFVMGSVADKVLHASKLPMWLVRPRKIIRQINSEKSENTILK
jgi:nucleotide-binding universal stress UspA family protein